MRIVSLIAILILLLSRCSAGGGTDTVAPDEDSLEALRETAKAEEEEKEGEKEKIFAMAYLGGTEGENRAEDIREEVISSELSLQYPFLLEIPEDHIVAVGGCEWYCIVPLDTDATLSVSTLELSDGGELKPVETVYEGGSAPILLLANVSDLFPNVLVTVETARYKVSFSPYISLKDGAVSATAEDGLYCLFGSSQTDGETVPET